MKITLGSLFDGIGGFPLAASRYGIKALWASEIEPFPIKVTKIRLPDMKHLGDITKINGAEIEPVDIITFGSPCQDLSVAGKRAGLAGERSGLFMEAVRIIKEMRSTYDRTNEPIRPRFAVWENVPGAFSSNKGEDFRAVLEEICRVKDETVTIPKPPKGKWNTVGAIMGNGYSVAWRILDAQYWGVPQRRRRIFLVADFGGSSAPEILFKRKGLSRHSQESGETRERIATDAERSTRTAISVDTSHADDVVRISDKTIPALQSRSYKGGSCVMTKDTPKTASGFDGYNGDLTGELASTLGVNCGMSTGRNGVITPTVVNEAHSIRSIGKASHVVKIPVYDIGDRRSVANESIDNSPTLTARMGTGGNNVPVFIEPQSYCLQGSMIGRADKNGPQGNGINDDVSFTLNTTDRHAVATVYALDRASFNQGENAQYDFQISGYGKTQTVISRGPSAVAEPPRYSVRRLTPLECERLQGFPDGWTDIPGQIEATQEELEFWRDVWLTWDKTQAEDPEKVKPRTDNRLLRWLKNPVSDSAQYKALGNSVAVPCPEYVIEGISEVLSTER